MSFSKSIKLYLAAFSSYLFSILFLNVFVLNSTSQASVRVAFFPNVVYQADGKTVNLSLEVGGQFYHVAISHQGKWLHSDVIQGVQLWSDVDMRRYSSAPVILTHPGLEEPSADTVWRLVGTPFDPTYSWYRQGSTYCSKLVGQLLGVAPQPMGFRGSAFTSNRQIVGRSDWANRVGEPGLSPDDIYIELLKRGFVPVEMAHPVVAGPVRVAGDSRRPSNNVACRSLFNE
jgi:hypothetical protein